MTCMSVVVDGSTMAFACYDEERNEILLETCRRDSGYEETEEIDETESSCTPDEKDPQAGINKKAKVRQPRHIPVTRRFKDTSSSKERRATVNGALGAFIDDSLDDSFVDFASKLEY